jgi:hypothetical protein
VVQDAAGLGVRAVELLTAPENARDIGRIGLDCIDSSRGSLYKLLDLIAPLLQEAA